jgi:hypothetical protein
MKQIRRHPPKGGGGTLRNLLDSFTGENYNFVQDKNQYKIETGCVIKMLRWLRITDSNDPKALTSKILEDIAGKRL